MKVLINTSNLNVGGGTQQTPLSFINELPLIQSEHEYHVLLSDSLNKQIDRKVFPKNFSFYLIKESPASLKSRKKIVSQLNKIENIVKPDVVFTLFSPAYWRPKAIHVIGFALGWITNPDSIAFDVLDFKQKIIRRLDSIYKSYFIKRDADYYIVETDDVKEKLFRVLEISKDNIIVVGNTYSSYFDEVPYRSFQLPKKDANEFRFVTIAHNYPHKNIKCIKQVLPYLRGQNINYKFFITISDESYSDLFAGDEDFVINLGPVAPWHCPSIYDQADAVFLPTLLESFTASYPEAMKMQKPIITSDLSFAHSICQDSALYFDSNNSQDIANKIIQISLDSDLRNRLILNGLRRLNTFETAQSRARKWIEICEGVCRRNMS